MNDDPRSAALSALTNSPDYHLRSLELSAAAMYAGASIEAVREALAARPDLPRRLSIEEEAALRFAIEYTDSADRDAFLAQVPAARVTGYCGCGCATVDLEIVDPSAPRASEIHPPFGDVSILEEDGMVIGGISIFVADGLICSIELSDYGDGPISPMPPLEQLVFDPARMVR